MPWLWIMSEDFMSLRTQFFPKSTWECWGSGIFSISEKKKNKVWRPQLSWFWGLFWINGQHTLSLDNRGQNEFREGCDTCGQGYNKGKGGTMEHWGVWPTVCRASGPGQMEAQGRPFTALWAGWSPHLNPFFTLTPRQALGLSFTVCPSIGGYQCGT